MIRSHGDRQATAHTFVALAFAMAPRRSGRLKPAPEACLTGTPDVSDANKKRVNIDCLPDVLLLHVLACVEPSQKHECRYGLVESA